MHGPPRHVFLQARVHSKVLGVAGPLRSLDGMLLGRAMCGFCACLFRISCNIVGVVQSISGNLQATMFHPPLSSVLYLLYGSTNSA